MSTFLGAAGLGAVTAFGAGLVVDRVSANWVAVGMIGAVALRALALYAGMGAAIGAGFGILYAVGLTSPRTGMQQAIGGALTGAALGYVVHVCGLF